MSGITAAMEVEALGWNQTVESTIEHKEVYYNVILFLNEDIFPFKVSGVWGSHVWGKREDGCGGEVNYIMKT